jgi:putative heme-binding domain-containing protein
LHANCAHCHRYGGAGNAKMRLAVDLSPESTRAYDVVPEHGGFGLRDAKLIASSSPESSVILYRLAKSGRGHMPPLGSQTADPAGLQLVHDWMASLPAPKDAALNHPERKSLATFLSESSSMPERITATGELLGSPSGALLMALAMDRHEVPTPGRAAIELGARSDDRNVRDLLERFLPPSERRARLGESVVPEQILELTGNPHEGRHLFLEATLQCKNCHRVAGQGTVLGPDLDRLSKRYSRAELLDSLLNPSETIDQRYQNYSVTTTSGRVLAGLLIEKTAEHLVLRDLQGNTHTIASGDIESAQQLKQSFMPAGLLRDLSAQEAADLVEFLFQLNTTTSAK